MCIASRLVLLYLVTSRARSYGHGLKPTPSGASVKVYAPHAKAVSVTGSFNQWTPGANRLLSRGHGWWEGNISSYNLALFNTPYKIEIITQDNQEFWRGDPWSRNQDGVTMGNSVAYDDNNFLWTDHDFIMPDWKQLVIYELHVGTFGRLVGESAVATLDMCILKLDHLVELGINAVELLPVAEFDGDADWGYTSAYLYAVEHAYGGPDAFKRFVNACHARGIAVLLDVVYNHLGPMDLPLWQFDGWSENDLGGIYFYNDERAKTPWAHTRPDYGKEHVRDYLVDNAAFWLDTMHCDGLRVDGVSFIRLWGGNEGNRDEAVFNPDGESFLKDLTRSSHKLGKLMIAEDLQSNTTLTAEISDGGLGFDSQWDGSFKREVRGALSEHNDDDISMSSLKASILAGLGGGLRRTLYVENHDSASHCRVAQQISAEPTSRSRKLTSLAAALVMTSPGMPLIFQGQELFLQDSFSAYSPMDWAKKFTEAGIFRLHRDLVRLRRNLLATSRGLTGSGVHVSINESSKVLVMSRWDEHGPGDDVLVAFHFRGQTSSRLLEFPAHATWKLAFNSDSLSYWGEVSAAVPEEVVTELSSHGQAQGTVTLPPYACLIYVRAPQRRLEFLKETESDILVSSGGWSLQGVAHLFVIAMQFF